MALTEKQISWALTHDWALAATDAGLIVEEVWVQNGKRFSRIFVWDGDFASLRAWAGY